MMPVPHHQTERKGSGPPWTLGNRSVRNGGRGEKSGDRDKLKPFPGLEPAPSALQAGAQHTGRTSHTQGPASPTQGIEVRGRV